MTEFEDFMIERNDELEQAAYALLWQMTHPGENLSDMIPAWGEFDMAQIGPLLADAEDILSQVGIPVCHPYYDEAETPCFLTGECKFPLCPMRQNNTQNGGK